MEKTEKKWLVGITDHLKPPADIEQQGFPNAEFVYLPDWHLGDKEAEQWRQMDALLTWHYPIDEETVAVLHNCKIVVRYGVGYDTVNIPAPASRGIPLCNTPDYGTEEIADVASAMILAIQRKIVSYDQLARRIQRGWQENLIKPHARTSTLTLGVIGVGRIGTAVINRMKPFGYHIVGYDPYQPSGHEKAVGYERVWEQDELLQQADIITLHCPLTSETRGMIDSEFMGKMKQGAALVNTARGGILAGLDVIEEALRTGHLSFAYMDVLPDEPPKPHPLLDAWRADADWLRGRLLITPHTAYYTEQGWFEMRFKAAQTARLFLEQNKLRNLIQP